MDGTQTIKTSGQQLIGKADAWIASGYIGMISVWRGAAGELFDSGDNVKAMALSDLAINKYVSLAWGEVRDDQDRMIYKGWLASAWEV